MPFLDNQRFFYFFLFITTLKLQKTCKKMQKKVVQFLDTARLFIKVLAYLMTAKISFVLTP